MNTKVSFTVPIPRAGSATVIFDVEAEVEVGTWTTAARVSRLSAGDWSVRWGDDCGSRIPAMGLTDWERDYLRELALLAFRHSRLAWPGATTQVEAMKQGGWR